MGVVLNLDELDNADNVEDGKPNDTLFTYHVAAYDDYTHFEPHASPPPVPLPPQYKNLKMASSYF